jgi:hypothetical protein
MIGYSAEVTTTSSKLSAFSLSDLLLAMDRDELLLRGLFHTKVNNEGNLVCTLHPVLRSTRAAGDIWAKPPSTNNSMPVT